MEIVAVLISFAVLILQIIQVVRYVRLESEVKRATTELDQSLARLHRTLELTRAIYFSMVRHHRFYLPLLNEINKEGPAKFWTTSTKYEHLNSEADNYAKLNSYTVELQAIVGLMQDKELAQLTESIVDWIEQPQKYANTLFGEFQSLILQTQEQIYRHIDRRLSIRFS